MKHFRKRILKGLAKSVLMAAILHGQAYAAVTVESDSPKAETPAMPDMPASNNGAGRQQDGTLGKRVKLPPPAPQACITPEELNAALGGSGCTCTCEEYGKKPSRTCWAACSISYYNCWAPDPTPAEVDPKMKEIYSENPEMAAVLQAQENKQELLDGFAAGIRMQRATEYQESLMCK